ncbi:hypothetical protein FRB90_011177 [Tulasnella sp. 427]|nr:hypothetical protein FRB90_011177 [Tulasnella sp. 427]
MGYFPLRKVDIKRIEVLLKGAHSPCQTLLFPKLRSLKWSLFRPICTRILSFLSPDLVKLHFLFYSATLKHTDEKEGSVMDRFTALDLPKLKVLALEGPVTAALVDGMAAKMRKLQCLDIALINKRYWSYVDSTEIVPLLQHNALSGLCDIQIRANLSPDLLHHVLQTVGSAIAGLKKLIIATAMEDSAEDVELDESNDELLDTLLNALGTCPELVSLTLRTYFHLDITTSAAQRVRSNLKGLKHLALLCVHGPRDEHQDFSGLEALAHHVPNLEELDLHLDIPLWGIIKGIGSYLPSFTFQKAVHLSASFTLPFQDMDLDRRELDLEQWNTWEERIWDYIGMLLPYGSVISSLERYFDKNWDEHNLGASLSKRLVSRDDMEAVVCT